MVFRREPSGSEDTRWWLCYTYSSILPVKRAVCHYKQNPFVWVTLLPKKQQPRIAKSRALFITVDAAFIGKPLNIIKYFEIYNP
jgi:hypothetical protein